MREGNAPLVRREDYAAPPFWIRKVDLTFDLDPAKTMVINRMQIERNDAVAAGPLKLHGEDLKLTRVLVNGESVSFRHEDGLLVIDNLPEGSFTLEISNTCAPEREHPACRACTPRAAASSRSARPRAFAASPTSSTGPT